jgi:hypothetical protein
MLHFHDTDILPTTRHEYTLTKAGRVWLTYVVVLGSTLAGCIVSFL